MVASYWFNAPQPIYCIDQNGPCSGAGAYNFETSWGSGNCGAGNIRTRQELSAARFALDLYDDIGDLNYTDSIGHSSSSEYRFGAMIEEIASWSVPTRRSPS